MCTKCYCSFYFLRYLVNQSSVAWDIIQCVCQMAQTLFSRCTRKLSRSVFIQMTHHQLVFYETTHGPLKQPNDIKTTRPTWIMNNGLCSLPGLIKMKETVIWFKKSYSCLYQICLWWSRGKGCCWPCMDSVCYVVHWFFQSGCLLYCICCLSRDWIYHVLQYVILLSETSHPFIWHVTCLIFEHQVCMFANKV